MDSKQTKSADFIIEHLLAVEVDGEMMQYIIKGVHLEHQMFRQIGMQMPESLLLEVISEFRNH